MAKAVWSSYQHLRFDGFSPDFDTVVKELLGAFIAPGEDHLRRFALDPHLARVRGVWANQKDYFCLLPNWIHLSSFTVKTFLQSGREVSSTSQMRADVSPRLLR